MPMIKAFQGWRYNPLKIAEVADVLAPPYDVISRVEQEALHKRSPYNVIRLILGKEEAGDDAADNKYARAGRALRAWMSSGILVKEKTPAVYVYVQNYKEGQKPKTRLGFMAAMKIDEKAVLKHENTLASPKKDRLALLKKVSTNLSPIFGLIEDKKGGVDRILKQALKLPAAVDVSVRGVRHRLFVEKRPELVEKLKQEMAAKPVYIADGHHRFEAACQFRRLMLSRNPRDAKAGWNYVMTYFSDWLHNPFTIFPTHRLILVPKVLKDPIALLKQRGALEKVSGLRAVLSRLSEIRERTKDPGRYRFGIYTKKGGFYIFTLDRKRTRPRSSNPADKLDVAVLHQRLLEPCFHIQAVEKSKAIDFKRDPEAAALAVKKGDFDMAIFVRPASLGEMIRISKRGLRMPQKSTYFYPKLLSGLVFHSFDAD